MIAMCAVGLLGVNACFAVYDNSVAFLHPWMDEAVFVHPPKADQLVKRRAMSGTCRASRLWADKVKFVLRLAGCFVLRTMSTVFWYLVDKYTLAVWRDDFGAAGVPEALPRLTFVLSENCESKEVGNIGPNKCGHAKLLNRIIEYKPGVFQWHSDVKHFRAVIELVDSAWRPASQGPLLGARRPAAQRRGRA